MGNRENPIIAGITIKVLNWTLEATLENVRIPIIAGITIKVLRCTLEATLENVGIPIIRKNQKKY